MFLASTVAHDSIATFNSSLICDEWESCSLVDSVQDSASSKKLIVLSLVSNSTTGDVYRMWRYSTGADIYSHYDYTGIHRISVTSVR